MSSPPFKVKALHDYSSPHDDDLTFNAGTIITVTEEEDADWYVGEYTDPSGTKQDGLFPRNFVERYEPAAPPRPTRSRPKKEIAPESSEEAPRQTSIPAEKAVQEPASSVPSEEPAPAPPVATSPVTEMPSEPRPEVAKPAPTATSRAPPPVSEKPSSFRDRIAAFNKGSAPPIAPKPVGAPSGQGFIKKPFVAPPPARNSYVPVQREQAPVHKPYRRDEDPEIAEEQARAQKDAEAAGLAGDGATAANEGEEAPKSTSLKDRIALLQKQQQEQAARRAEATTKTKRPAKGDVTEPGATLPADEDAESRKATTRTSMDGSQELSKPQVTRMKSRDVQPAASIVSDGNEADQSGAGDTTEDAAGDSSTEVDEPSDKTPARPELPLRGSATSVKHEDTSTRTQASESHGQVEGVGSEEDDDEDEEEEDMDPEVRRKMELRERMAKMSGGMGMPGMFAPPGMAVPSKKSKPVRKTTEEETIPQSPPQAPRVPMVPIPGMSQPVDEAEDEDEEAVSKAEDAEAEESHSASVAPIPTGQAKERGAPPPVPRSRPIESEPRGLPPPPPPPRPADPVAADVEAAEALEEGHALPTRGVPPPVPGAPLPPARPEGPRSPQSQARRESLTSDLPSPPPPPPRSPESRHVPRVPPIPGAVPTIPPPSSSEGSRPPPPPPPPTAAPPSRQSTQQESDQDEESAGGSDYEGDYDTDIASGAPHKEALKSHNKSPSGDETLSEGPRSPQQRPAPPPPPHAPPTKSSKETYEMSGAIRPPPPPPRDSQVASANDDYDPYRYSGVPAAAVGQFKESNVQEPSDPSLYARPESLASAERPPPPPPQSPPQQVHNVPPPLPPQHQELAPASESTASRTSTDAPRRSMEPRSSMNQARRSTEHGRHAAEQGVTAHDVDLGASSLWWTHPNTIPPVFAGRGDILYELEENSSSKRGGRTTISRDVYVLFPDYSQTIVSARFDNKDPSDAQLEQRHEPPPAQPSQQALEQAHGQLAGAIVAAASQLVNAAAVEGGTPQGLIRKCIASTSGSLPPIGFRSYGALVYANLGNASVTQHDEIRPGDVVTLRNARFQGKHGPMHTKYSLDISGEHVAIVNEWDGTKKKVRVWEQGRASPAAKDKVRVESFKFGDLRSGEVKVWRVMPRAWVGWDGDA